MRRYSWNRETASASDDGEAVAAEKRRRRGKKKILDNPAMIGICIEFLPLTRRDGRSCPAFVACGGRVRAAETGFGLWSWWW
jgi:hypothetical protein